ncbi:MAG: glycosyltransferase family 2 protein [Pseudomonadota bacterium]
MSDGNGSSPTVSVGLPVYNGERYLGEAIECILGQKGVDLELVISDNASTDRTAAIAREAAERDPRVKYFRNETNLGAATNYNRAYELSSGRYFKWAAADDLFSEDMLARCIEKLESRSDAVLCYTGVTIIGPDGKAIRPYEEPFNLDVASPVERFHKLRGLLGECNAVFGVMRREAIEKTSVMEPFLASDAAFLRELVLYGPFLRIPEALFYRREHPDAFSSLKEEKERVAFFDPAMRMKPPMKGWSNALRDLKSIRRAPLQTSEKMHLYRAVMRTLKWKRGYYHELGQALSYRARSLLSSGLDKPAQKTSSKP